MVSVGILLFCLQACLVHNVLGQCIADPSYGYGPAISPYAAIAPGYAPGYGYGIPGAPGIPGPGLPGTYGGSGAGDIAVVGELPVIGTTVVVGQVPVLGAVQFGGMLPAAGAVTISGFCSCGCNPGYVY